MVYGIVLQALDSAHFTRPQNKVLTYTSFIPLNASLSCSYCFLQYHVRMLSLRADACLKLNRLREAANDYELLLEAQRNPSHPAHSYIDDSNMSQLARATKTGIATVDW